MSLIYPRHINPSDIERLEKYSIYDVKKGDTKMYYYVCDTLKNWWIVKYEETFYTDIIINRVAFFDRNSSWKAMKNEMSYSNTMSEKILKDWIFYEPKSQSPPAYTSVDTITKKMYKLIPPLYLSESAYIYSIVEDMGSMNLFRGGSVRVQLRSLNL